MTYYDFWSYHNSPVDPIRPTNHLIFGLELEINYPTFEAEEAIDNMISDDVLGSPDNGGSSSINAQIEYDSSVWAEIIFSAGYKSDILNSIDEMNQYGLDPSTVPNSRGGTSAHISISNEYLSDHGITRTSLTRIMELYSPVLFAISGRGKREAGRWATPQAYDLGFIDWYLKVQKAQQVNPNESHGSRYRLLNCESSYKSELRIFSNNHGGFDYARIEFYLSIVEFIIEQAKKMRGKRYIHHYRRLLAELEDFIKTAYPVYYSKYGLFFVFHPLESIAKYKAVYQSSKNYINRIEGRIYNLEENPHSTCNHMAIIKEASDRGIYTGLAGTDTASILAFAEYIKNLQYGLLKSYGQQVVQELLIKGDEYLNQSGGEL